MSSAKEISVGCQMSVTGLNHEHLGIGTYLGHVYLDKKGEETEGESNKCCSYQPKIKLDSGEIIYGYECWWMVCDIKKALHDFYLATKFYSGPYYNYKSTRIAAATLLKIGMPVVDYIFENKIDIDIQVMILLTKITGENPIQKKHAGLIAKMRNDWNMWYQIQRNN